MVSEHNPQSENLKTHEKAAKREVVGGYYPLLTAVWDV